MEAASLPLRLRARAQERELARLRPLGEAYLLRRFGGSLNRADAEDAVAEVLIRLHRRLAEGRAPENLRAAFFTSCRNAAIDQLRSRAAKPTVALEAAAEKPAEAAAPAEWAEGREDAVRLQEALGRMRGNYREAILLRFGLGLTVPEMAEQLGISLPAAKKLVLRATRQVRQRLEAIDGQEFCPEMRELARGSLLEKRAVGLASEAESEVLRAHFSHCGSCRSFLSSLHDTLHDLGAAAVLGLGASERAGVRLGLLDHLARWSGAAHDGVQAGAARLRHLAYKASGAFPSADAGSTGALMGTGQKIVAICGTATAATATCLLSGAVGPGLGASATLGDPPPRPPAQVRTTSAPAPVEPAPVSAPTPSPPSEPSPEPAPESVPHAEEATSSPPPAPASPVQSVESPPTSEFGLESGSPSSPSPPTASTPSVPSSTARSTVEAGGELGGGGSSSSSTGSGGGAVGFQG